MQRVTHDVAVLGFLFLNIRILVRQIRVPEKRGPEGLAAALSACDKGNTSLIAQLTSSKPNLEHLCGTALEVTVGA